MATTDTLVYKLDGAASTIKPKPIVDSLPQLIARARKSTEEVGKEIYDMTVNWLPEKDRESPGSISPQEISADSSVLKKWGVSAKKWLITRTFPVLDNPNASTYGWFYGLVASAAAKNGHSPEFLHSVIMGEGMTLVIDFNQTYGVDAKEYASEPVGWTEDPLVPDPKNPKSLIPDTPVPGNWYNSYRICGLDNYGETIDELVGLGYLSAEFKTDLRFSPFSHTIENDHKDPKKRRRVRPATIKGLDAVVYGVSAELNRSSVFVKQRLSRTGRNKQDYNLSDSQAEDRDLREFLTYVHFNAHPDDFNDVMRKLKSDYYLKASRELYTIEKLKNNALIRVASADRMRILGLYNGYGGTDYAAAMMAL